jgi:hypothetical protein
MYIVATKAGSAAGLHTGTRQSGGWILGGSGAGGGGGGAL